MTYRKILSAVFVLTFILITAVSSAATPSGVTAFIRDRHLTRYSAALFDLNSDNKPEALIYAMSTHGADGQLDFCGSGGCTLYVLSLDPAGYRLVSSIMVVQLPVRVMSSMTHGWHDLGVWVAGGGNTVGYEARLRFDGHRYPQNPTMRPAVLLKNQTGKTVIEALPTNK